MRAAITSIGVVSGHGLGCEVLLEAVLQGKSSIRALTRFRVENLCSDLAAEAPGDDLLIAWAQRLKWPSGDDRASRLLLAAGAEALAGRDLSPNSRRGVVVGTTKGALERAVCRWEVGELPGEDVLGLPTQALALATGARGPVLTVGGACASSAVALGEALALLEDGTCNEVVVGGTEALHRFVYSGFHSLKALSPLPAAPFDVDRAGLSLGEGAAVLVIESLDSMGRAGRTPIAWVEGFASTTDGFDQTAPDPAGTALAFACRRALEQAGARASAVDRYHAHGTATVHNDAMEAAVHAAVFEGREVPVCAIKGSVGHALGAAAALDLAVCALTLQKQVLPPVANLKRVDPSARVPAVIGPARRSRGEWALVVNAGFGGVNTAVVLRRPARSP